MVDKDYELNMNGVEELINYLILLRKQNNVSEETLAKYTGITKLCIKMIEERRVIVPRLETFLQLSSFWSLKDEQIIEIYQVLCDKNKQLTFTAKDNWTVLKKVDIDKSELYSLSEKLKHIRKSKRLTMVDISEQTGILASSISGMENKKRVNSLNLIIPLCKFYGIKSDEVLDFYHRTLKQTNKLKPINLDVLNKDQLIEIILNQDLEPDKYFSEKQKKLTKVKNIHSIILDKNGKM